MKTLIVEDDFDIRLVLQEILQRYGPCHIAVNGTEAVNAARSALVAGAPYDLICLDIMMPEMDGQEALREIRLMEDTTVIAGGQRAKIIMITALADQQNVIKSRQHQCDYYLVKPIRMAVLTEHLRKLKLID